MYRTAADRKAEAARYRQMTEAASIPEVSLAHCEYDSKRKVLKLASEAVGMPRQLFITSDRTGKQVRFVVVGPEDKLFCEDQWDGEQQVYRPVGNVRNVDHLVIYNQW